MGTRFFISFDKARVLVLDHHFMELASVGVHLHVIPVDHAHLLVVELQPLPVFMKQNRVMACNAVVPVVNKNTVQLVGIAALDPQFLLAVFVHVQSLGEFEAVLDLLVRLRLEIKLAAPEVEHQHLRQLHKADPAVCVLLAPLVRGVPVVSGQLLFRQEIHQRVFDREELLGETLEAQLNVDEVLLPLRFELDVPARNDLFRGPVEQGLYQIALRVFGLDPRVGEGVLEVLFVVELFLQIVHQEAAKLLDVLLDVGRLAGPAEGLHEFRKTRRSFRVFQVEEQAFYYTTNGPFTVGVRK